MRYIISLIRVIELKSARGVDLEFLECPTCGWVHSEPVQDLDFEAKWKIIVFHCWSAHDAKTAEDMERISGMRP